MIRTLAWLAFGLPALLAAAECTFLPKPQDFLERQSRAGKSVYQRTMQFAFAARSTDRAPASELPPRNFIDEEIFQKLAQSKVPAARQIGDEDFLRRVSLDLTGRLPTPDEIREFLGSSSPTKRDDAVDRLLFSRAFTDRWTMWFGDLLENCSFPALFDRREDGRNAYYFWIKSAVNRNASIREMASTLITATGNHYDDVSGAANFPITGKTNMGPSQDTYDNMLVKASTMFLGMAQYDCVLCHNGRGHLDEINLWGKRTTRLEAQHMAAFFARLNMPSRNVPDADFYHFSYDVSDRTSGTYDLNTSTGNRPDRVPAGTVKNLTPEYRETAAAPQDGNWRAAFAANLTRDPMFARNFANRLWREMFGLGLVEPYDMLDPDRLDPSNPPPAPWALQATHPELLEKLAGFLTDTDFNFREFLRLLVFSNAYQMSSRYDGPWKVDYVPLFARHYPRRLMAEEIHDRIALATGVLGSYVIKNWAAPATLALQLPEPAEPRKDGNVANFLNFFLRGNRDSQPRTQDLTILQRLNIMNDPFVLNRLKVSASPGLQAIARIADNGGAVEELFLRFLARRPSDSERQSAMKYLETGQADRNGLIEDLAWVAVNKAEFLFSY